MTHIAAPTVAGVVSATVLALPILPIVYEIRRARQLRRAAGAEDAGS